MAAERWPHARGACIKMQLSGLQMGQMAISRIETGKRLVADFELKIFAHALGVTMEWLTAENEK